MKVGSGQQRKGARRSARSGLEHWGSTGEARGSGSGAPGKARGTFRNAMRRVCLSSASAAPRCLPSRCVRSTTETGCWCSVRSAPSSLCLRPSHSALGSQPHPQLQRPQHFPLLLSARTNTHKQIESIKSSMVSSKARAHAIVVAHRRRVAVESAHRAARRMVAHAPSALLLLCVCGVSMLQSNFEALGMLPELISAVEGMGWTLPSAVQDEAIPLILGGGDVLIAAETGSGKCFLGLTRRLAG